MNTLALNTAQFHPDEIINVYEMRILEVTESIFRRPHRCLVELPLQRVCAKVGYLENEIWRFWRDSRIDIVVMLPNSKAGLAIECQSSFHDSPEAKFRDERKAAILAKARIPLIYVRQGRQRNTYQFWLPNARDNIKYNPSSPKSHGDLSSFLKANCLAA